MRRVCVLDQIFLEYQSVFSDVFGKTSKEILLLFNSPSDCEDILAAQLEKLLKNIALKGFVVKKINTISSLAETSFGLQSLRLKLKMLIEQINFIESQIKEIEIQIDDLLKEINSPITTIPGVGSIIGATILSEMGDIYKLSNNSELVAYAGIDASVKQSGEFHSPNNKMSKRGSPYLRVALFRAALEASTCDPVFKAFYLAKSGSKCKAKSL